MRFKLHAAVALLTALPLVAVSIPESKPEEVGLSRERLVRVKEAIQRHMDSNEFSGAVTLVARKGRIAHVEAQGVMDLESKAPMKRDTIFRVFSMSKPVAAVAILMLMEEGKVQLNDPVSKFIPEFRGMKVAVAQELAAGQAGNEGPKFYTIPATREITIQDLLTHVSGLGSGPASNAEMSRIARKDTEGLTEFVPRFGTTPLDFQPGSRWAYSPLFAFDTLGRVVEIASGQSFNEFLKRRVFEPLGMKETFFHPGTALWPRVATGYERKGNSLKKAENANFLASEVYFSGAGGLMSTADDYARFAEMLLEGGQLGGKRLLSPKTVELMSSVFVPDTVPGRTPGVGFGLSVRIITDPIAAGHRVSAGSYGWDGLYGTHFWIDPKEKVVGILLIQTANSNRQLDRDFEGAVMQSIVE